MLTSTLGVTAQARDLGIFRYDFAGTAMDGEAVVVRVWLKAVKQRQEVRVVVKSP